MSTKAYKESVLSDTPGSKVRTGRAVRAVHFTTFPSGLEVLSEGSSGLLSRAAPPSRILHPVGGRAREACLDLNKRIPTHVILPSLTAPLRAGDRSLALLPPGSTEANTHSHLKGPFTSPQLWLHFTVTSNQQIANIFGPRTPLHSLKSMKIPKGFGLHRLYLSILTKLEIQTELKKIIYDKTTQQ